MTYAKLRLLLSVAIAVFGGCNSEAPRTTMPYSVRPSVISMGGDGASGVGFVLRNNSDVSVVFSRHYLGMLSEQINVEVDGAAVGLYTFSPMNIDPAEPELDQITVPSRSEVMVTVYPFLRTSLKAQELMSKEDQLTVSLDAPLLLQADEGGVSQFAVRWDRLAVPLVVSK